jgi:hypothetical protein
VFHWVQGYAPEINKMMRPYLQMSGTSYRLDFPWAEGNADSYLLVRTLFLKYRGKANYGFLIGGRGFMTGVFV